MTPSERYAREAPAPAAPTLHETVRYLFDELQRRAYHSTLGLTDEDLNVDPGHGAWTIGRILQHQLFLVQFMTEKLRRGSTQDLPQYSPHPQGPLLLDTILEQRETLGERFQSVFAEIAPESLMKKCPEMPPDGWAEWPALMRILRPLTDLATHVGQVNYARRQLGKPLGSK
jgi:hypothetical protein